MAVDAATTGQLTGPADPTEDPVAGQTATADNVAPQSALDAEPTVRRHLSSLRWPLALGVVVLLVMASLFSWLGYRAYETRQDEQLRGRFLQAGRQAALNLTTITAHTAESDVARVLDSTTGAFHDDWAQRAPAFVDVVKKAQSQTTGSVTAAALESVAAPDKARVLVAVSVTTNTAGTPEQEPRAWRMRIDVQKVGDDVKVTDVEFVP